MNGRPFDKLRANGQVNLLTDFAQALASSPCPFVVRSERTWAKVIV